MAKRIVLPGDLCFIYYPTVTTKICCGAPGPLVCTPRLQGSPTYTCLFSCVLVFLFVQHLYGIFPYVLALLVVQKRLWVTSTMLSRQPGSTMPWVWWSVRGPESVPSRTNQSTGQDSWQGRGLHGTHILIGWVVRSWSVEWLWFNQTSTYNIYCFLSLNTTYLWFW